MTTWSEADPGAGRVSYASAMGKALLRLNSIVREFRPDVVHCHDWHTALAPLFLKTLYSWDRLFDDLPVPRTKLRRVRNLIPSALRGLYNTPRESMAFTDVEDGRRGLIDALVAYLQ